MTSGDRETNARASWPEVPGVRHNDIPMSPSRGPKGSNLEGTMDFDSNIAASRGTRLDGIVSYVLSEDSGSQNRYSAGNKVVTIVESRSVDADAVTLGIIMKRTSLTIESMREGSMSSTVALA